MSTPCHLVIIDDERGLDTLFQAYFEDELSEGRLKISYFESGESYFISCKKLSKVSLILCDINLGGMNGYQILDRICQDTNQFDFYMLSGYTSDDFVSKAMAKGAKGFLDKPLDLIEVRKLIESYYIG